MTAPNAVRIMANAKTFSFMIILVSSPNHKVDVFVRAFRSASQLSKNFPLAFSLMATTRRARVPYRGRFPE
jgi:hypothetical protein